MRELVFLPIGLLLRGWFNRMAPPSYIKSDVLALLKALFSDKERTWAEAGYNRTKSSQRNVAALLHLNIGLPQGTKIQLKPSRLNLWIRAAAVLWRTSSTTIT